MKARVFMSSNNLSVRSVLIYSNGELIGDGMMKMPFIRALPRAFPNAQVTWLAGRHKTIFKTALHPLVSPYIHNIVDQTGFGERWPHIWQKPWEKTFSNQNFDVIIDTEKKIIPALMLKQIPHKLFISSAFKWNFSEKKPNTSYKKPLLLVDRLLDLLTVATEKKANPIYDIEIPEKWMVIASDLMKDFLGKKKIVLLAPGAGGRFKCWPLEKFVGLAQRLEDEGAQPLFILGPAEPEWRKDIEKLMPSAIFPLQNTTENSVYLTIALGALADVNVANDGGVGHILASSNKPTISMWGPTDPLKSTPNGQQVIVVKSQDFGGEEMYDIPLSAIYEKVTTILKHQTPVQVSQAQ
ncbi:MAG: lipopolysaccharide heptosyltransferase family protein [Alphaproteobacteria bacterium]|nr:lipopolysaccharide heptosyltransferase family protein [Alphaproteobacteria bacterium]